MMALILITLISMIALMLSMSSLKISTTEVNRVPKKHR